MATVRRVIHVELPYAAFGITCEGGVVTGAPPIAHWALGAEERRVARYFRRREAKITVMEESDGEDLPPPAGSR